MWKIIARIVPAVAIVLLLFGGTAQAATADAAAGATSAPRTTGSADAATQHQPTETRAIVVGALAFILMVGTAGAVVWHTARARNTAE